MYQRSHARIFGDSVSTPSWHRARESACIGAMSTPEYAHLFARRMDQMRPSTIREILKVTAQPEVISFAGGLPNPDFFL